MIGPLSLARTALVGCQVALLLLTALAGGCQARVWLLADSHSDYPRKITSIGPQRVHVGELVTFEVLVKPSIDDYVIFEFPGEKALLDADPVWMNYVLKRKFDQPTGPDGVTVTVTAYRARGRPDFHMVDGRVVQSGLGSAGRADHRLGSAKMKIIVYQSEAVFTGVGGAGAEPDWSKTELRILADGGKRVGPAIRLAGAPSTAPADGGFELAGPDGRGQYTIRYRPTAEQVNRFGTTVAELRWTDAAGNTRAARTEFATP